LYVFLGHARSTAPARQLIPSLEKNDTRFSYERSGFIDLDKNYKHANKDAMMVCSMSSAVSSN